MKKLLAVLLISALGFAAARPAAYFSPKRLGMGGAGIAVVEKENSYFYNPAHAAEIKNSLHLPALLLIPNSFYYNTTTLELLDKLGDINIGSSDDDNKNDTVDAFRKVVPSRFGLGGTYSAGLVFSFENIGSFALGGYGAGRLDADVLNRLSPRFDMTGYADGVFSLTYAREIPLESFLQEQEEYPADPEAPRKFSFLPFLKIFKEPKAGVTLKNITRASLYDTEEDTETFSLEVLELLDEDKRKNPPVAARVGGG
jgi:hypothetical protein